ncbi:glycerophosphodiester phosphodiesterase [soil metagenome]
MKHSCLEIIGHAGAAGFHPYNSAESIQKAIDLGVDRIEIDLLGTLDGDLLLIHDVSQTVEDREQLVEQLTTEQVRTNNPEVLTLANAYELTSGKVPLLIDVKGKQSTRALIAALRRFDVGDNVSISSTHARVLRELRHAFPHISLGLSRGHALTRIPSRKLKMLGGQTLSLPQIGQIIALSKWCGATDVMVEHHLCTRLLVRSAHQTGFRVNAWTVDIPSDIERVQKSGVDGIISNRPDRVFAIVRPEIAF